MTYELPDPWHGVRPPVPGAGPSEPLLVTIGDIGITRSSVVTPSGTAPIGQVQFFFTDQSYTTEAIPAWAIVLAVVFAVFCLLGLLFLLAKETRTVGWVQVVVQGPRLHHTVQLPVGSPHQVLDYSARVNYARSVSAAAQ